MCIRDFFARIIHVANIFEMNSSQTLMLQNGYIPSKSTYKTILEGLSIKLPYGSYRRNNKTEIEDPASVSMLRQKLPIPRQQNEIQGKKHAYFEFLLFVLDSVTNRNIAIDAMFYSSVVLEGKRLGGLPRKFASLLVDARKITLNQSNSGGDIRTNVFFKADENSQHCNEKQIDEVSSASEHPLITSWEELFQHWDILKKRLDNEESLPRLEVRIGNRDIRTVLFSEQNTFSYRSKKNVGKEARRQSV